MQSRSHASSAETCLVMKYRRITPPTGIKAGAIPLVWLRRSHGQDVGVTEPCAKAAGRVESKHAFHAIPAMPCPSGFPRLSAQHGRTAAGEILKPHDTLCLSPIF